MANTVVRPDRVLLTRLYESIPTSPPGRNVTDASLYRILPLTCLAPDIVEAILDGRQPKGLRLAEMLGNGPLGWEEQRHHWHRSQRSLRMAGRDVVQPGIPCHGWRNANSPAKRPT